MKRNDPRNERQHFSRLIIIPPKNNRQSTVIFLDIRDNSDRHKLKSLDPLLSKNKKVNFIKDRERTRRIFNLRTYSHLRHGTFQVMN